MQSLSETRRAQAVEPFGKSISSMKSPTFSMKENAFAGLAFANGADATDAAAGNVSRGVVPGHDEDPTRHVSLQRRRAISGSGRTGNGKDTR
jgi:hypothetical protein